MVHNRTDDWVEIPFGLVGLYWIKLYQPLMLRYQLPQLQGQANAGFAGDAFRQLADVSPLDLRIGQPMAGEFSATVLHAIRDACRTIHKMPAHYTTHPGTDHPVFETRLTGIRIRATPARLDHDTLARFGTVRVPALLWDCCSRYACWLEPAIINEWASLMQAYGSRPDMGTWYAALQWEEGRRDTSRVRALVDNRIQHGDRVHCVWTDLDLRRRSFAVDHCFPWSRWGNNDLWNLLPATTAANANKAEKLPAAPLLQAARERITSWWETAFLGTAQEEQFFVEAQAGLPMVGDQRSLYAVFDGVAHQRRRLKRNQQLAEWYGLNTKAHDR